MKTVDVDLNFIFLILMLAIVLLAAITGFNVGRMTIDKSGIGLVAGQGIFLFLCMALLALALLLPYLVYWVGHAAILLSGVKLASFVYIYIFKADFFTGISSSLLTAELISTMLILASGIILVKSNPKI